VQQTFADNLLPPSKSKNGDTKKKKTRKKKAAHFSAHSASANTDERASGTCWREKRQGGKRLEAFISGSSEVQPRTPFLPIGLLVECMLCWEVADCGRADPKVKPAPRASRTVVLLKIEVVEQETWAKQQTKEAPNGCGVRGDRASLEA
jgi:hypothetical protein